MTGQSVSAEWSSNLEAWRALVRRVDAQADRTERMIMARARAACSEAGLDPTLVMIHPHNAMCSYRQGKPWTGVDYGKVRLALHLIELSYRPHTLATHAISRAYARYVQP